MKTFRLLTLSVVCLAMAACTTKPPANGIEKAAMTPLNDLNLARSEIPPLLSQANAAPYKLPTDVSCAALSTEISELDEVLGPDVDTPEESDSSKTSLTEKGSKQVSGAAMGALQNTGESVVPFRGWVRKLTGAERHSRKVNAAIMAGNLRRGFLKGIRAAQPCAATPTANITPAEPAASTATAG